MATHVELPQRKSRKTRLVCYCGKPLDQLNGRGEPLRAGGPLIPLLDMTLDELPAILPTSKAGRHGPAVPALRRAGGRDLSADLPAGRFRWRCRKCGATPILTQDQLSDAADKCRRVGRDVCLGVDL